MRKKFKIVPVLKIPERLGGGYMFRPVNIRQDKALCITAGYMAMPSHDSKTFILEYEEDCDKHNDR